MFFSDFETVNIFHYKGLKVCILTFFTFVLQILLRLQNLRDIQVILNQKQYMDANVFFKFIYLNVA